MARTGRPPKPIELKRRVGNPGHRPLPKGITAIQPAVVVMEPPARGDDLVAALMSGPAAAWIAQPDRVLLLELVREAWDERARLREDIARNGYGDGRYARQEVARLAHLERTLTTWLSLLGLSPTDRSRLGVAEVKARSKLEALRDRRASRNRAG